MHVPRRFLPSMPSLLALEALERHGTATRAAQELSLTHSAVSRQLKVLEDQLGVRLLIRQGQGLALTEAGRDYAHAVRRALQDLGQASLRLKAMPEEGRSLSLAMPPGFAMYWMGPRLGRFSRANPDIALHLGTALRPFDLREQGYDAAVHFGPAEWPGTSHLDLGPETVWPVMAPGLLPRAGSPQALLGALLQAPLLHLDSRPGAWEHWFDCMGQKVEGLQGTLLDDHATMAEAAAQGLGVALLPGFIADPMIAMGRLVRAWEAPVESPGSYRLVWPATHEPRAPLQKLIGWLSGDCG